MPQNIQVLILTNKTVLIAEVTEVMAEIGDPDCKLSNTHQLLDNVTELEDRIVPWLDVTNQSDIILRSSDILTVVEPKPEILAHYITLLD